MSTLLDCTVCDAPATHVCQRCQIARYCSADCQAHDYNHPEDGHSIWCFDRENPDIEHLEALIDACMERNVREGETEAPDHGPADLVFSSPQKAIKWLDIEMEDPFDIGASAFERALQNRRIRRGKAKVFKGKVKKFFGKRGEGEELIKKGRAQKARARKDKRRSRKAKKRKRRRKKKRRRRRRKKRRKRRRRKK